MKKLLVIIYLIFLFSCSNQKIVILNKYKEKKKINYSLTKDDELYNKNLNNIKDNFEIFVIKLDAKLYLDRPIDLTHISSNYIKLNFGDVLFPLKENNPIKYFFYVKTIDNKVGWIDFRSGISIDYNSDSNLYFFNKEYYLKRYIESKGNISNSDKIILIKNIVPLLLNNFTTEEWFYPSDYNLALQLSLYGLSISQDQDTFFYSASSYDWRVNETIICYNLIADSYHKLKQYDKSIEIHNKLIQGSNFWKRADNTQIGGLNSFVKLTKLYLDLFNEDNTQNKNEIKEKIISTILKIGNEYNLFIVMDKKWNRTVAEWLLDILYNNLTTEQFYDFCNILSKRTTSTGFADLILVYKALSLYKENKKEEAIQIFSKLKKPRVKFREKLEIEDWLSVNQIIPESLIYQYNY